MSTAHAVAQLRHLYAQMIGGHVRDTRSAATGILGPSIEELERSACSIDVLANRLDAISRLAPIDVQDADALRRASAPLRQAVRDTIRWLDETHIAMGDEGAVEIRAALRRALSPVESPGEADWSHRCPECGASVCSHVVLMARRAAAPREVEEVREALLVLARNFGHVPQTQIVKDALALASRLSSPSGEAPERGDGEGRS